MKQKTTTNEVESVPVYTAEEFRIEYEQLCLKTGYQITVNPAFKLSQETNDYRVVLQISIGETPKK